MPKRTQPPPAGMPTGRAFKSSVKKQKTTTSSAAAAAAGKAKAKASNGKGKQATKSAVAPISTAATRPKSLFKGKAPSTKDTQQSDNGKGKAKHPAAGSTNDRPVGDKTSSAKKTSKPTAAPSPPPRSFRIIVGSYERLLFGFHVKFDSNTSNDALQSPSFTPLFSFAAHTSCISAVAAAGTDSKWLATGAGDETVRVWDLRKRKEVGGLIGHGGTINALSFPTRTYLLSCDSSGLINLYRTRDWALLKTLRGHTGRVNACVAHPSGKVALSVGQDGMLRMWDMMRGKGAGAVRLRLGQTAKDEADEYATRVKEEPLDVRWCPSGARFVVMGRTEAVVFKTDMSRVASVVVRRDDPKHKFGSVEWIDDTTLMLGTEAGVVDAYHIGNDDRLRGPIVRLVGHENRVRALRTIRIRLSAATEQDITLAVTASSDGKLRVYDMNDLTVSDETLERQPIGTHSTGGARLTSMDVVGGSGVRTAALDSVETDLEDDDEEEENSEIDDEAALGSSDSDEGDAVQKDDESQDEDDVDMDPSEMEELNKLLDLVEEARTQGIEVEGMSDFATSDDDDGDDDDDDDDDDADDDDDGDDDGEEELKGESEG